MKFFVFHFQRNLILLLVFAFVIFSWAGLLSEKILAEIIPENFCPSFTENMDARCEEMGKKECQKSLEICEKYYQEKSDIYQKEINQIHTKQKNLQNEIWSLNQRIENLNSQIYRNNLVMKDLNIQIQDTSRSIEVKTERIEEVRAKLAGLLQAKRETDEVSIVEIFLREENLSDFTGDVMALDALNKEIQNFLRNIKSLKVSLKAQKSSMEEEKNELEHTQKIVNLQKQENQELRTQKDYILQETKGEEVLYQKYLQESQKKAREIKERIFELAGTTEAPTFGEAYEIAKYAEEITGVRPAFLLAVLQQESAIGKNVGQCYLKNTQTGAGVVIYNGKVVSRVMKPTRDVAPFLTITKELGRDPYSTPVSCPLIVGYGGAMGPAQFIPSTWAMYKDELANIMGRAVDPWNIRDAFLASALYLSKNGAKSQTRNGEWRAAMIYFSGSTRNPNFYWYANQVLAKADNFERDIELIK